MTLPPTNIDVDQMTRMLQRGRIARLVDYVAHDGQAVVHQAIDRGAKRVAIKAGRRGGKSECSALEAATEMAFRPVGHLPKRLVLIAGPEVDTTDHIFRLLWKWIVIEECFSRLTGRKVKLKASERERYIETPWHSRVEGKTTKDPTSLRGPGLVMTIGDEYAFGNDVLDEYLTKPLLDCNGILLLPTTPNGKNHFYDTYTDWETQGATDPFYATAHWTSYDNPYLPAGAVARDEAEAKRKGIHDLFRQECLAEFNALSGAVYPGFKPARHTGRPGVIQGLPVFTGYDWGFDHPFAAVFCQIQADGIVVLKELCERGKDIVELARMVNAELEQFERAGCPRGLGYADPSQPANIKLFREHGIPMWTPGTPGFAGRLNSVSDGITVVRSLIGRDSSEPGLLIHERCTNLISGMQGYVFKDSARTQKDTVVKKDDDMVDALRYVCNGLMGGLHKALWGFAA